jgi:branched-chain amino acid transport system permease protein
LSPEITITDTTRSGRITMVLALCAVMALACAPLVATSAHLNLMVQIFAYLALATLWNLLAGFSGLVSVGQQAFVGIGGYALFGLTIFADLHPLLALALAGIIGAVIALPVAGLLFRLRGAYFAIGSWVAAEVFRLLASQISALGGGSGTSLPARIVTSMASSRAWREYVIYWTGLAIVVVVIGLTIFLLRSRFGLALRAIHYNETAARASGVNVTRVKLIVFVLAGFGTAMVGALIFLQKLRISPDAAFSVNDWTAFVIFMAVIGGIGRIEGPIIGCLVFFVLRETLADMGALYLMMLGLVAIVIMLRAPRGIAGWLSEKLGFDLVPLSRRVVFSKSKGDSHV